MGWKERAHAFHRFVDGASSHITFWAFVIATVGVLGGFVAYVTAKANPVLAYFAPFSYVVAILVTLILLAWLARLLALLIRSLVTTPRIEAIKAPAPQASAAVELPAKQLPTSSTYEGDHEELMLFVARQLIPTIEAQQAIRRCVVNHAIASKRLAAFASQGMEGNNVGSNFESRPGPALYAQAKPNPIYSVVRNDRRGGECSALLHILLRAN